MGTDGMSKRKDIHTILSLGLKTEGATEQVCGKCTGTSVCARGSAQSCRCGCSAGAAPELTRLRPLWSALCCCSRRLPSASSCRQTICRVCTRRWRRSKASWMCSATSPCNCASLSLPLSSLLLPLASFSAFPFLLSLSLILLFFAVCLPPLYRVFFALFIAAVYFPF